MPGFRKSGHIFMEIELLHTSYLLSGVCVCVRVCVCARMPRAWVCVCVCVSPLQVLLYTVA